MIVIIVVCAFLIGVFSSSLGIGGGFLIVPILILVGVPAHLAIGVSAFSTIFTGISSFTGYLRLGRVDWKIGGTLECATVPGAVLGAYITQFFSSESLELIFSSFLMLVAYLVWRKVQIEVCDRGDNSAKVRVLRDKCGEVFKYKVNLPFLISVSFLAGMASGFFGISGGILKVPALILGGLPTYIAIGTSSLMITITSVASATSHGFLGNIDVGLILLIAPSLFVGAQVGPRLSYKLPEKLLRRIFAVVMVMMSVAIIVKGLIFI